jgi:hypothetical protein
MTRLARRASLVVVRFFALLTFAWVSPAAADNSCVSLRTFTLEERGKFEGRYGIEWWKALGLIPRPAQRVTGLSGLPATVPGCSTCRSSFGTFDRAWPLRNRLGG